MQLLGMFEVLSAWNDQSVLKGSGLFECLECRW